MKPKLNCRCQDGHDSRHIQLSQLVGSVGGPGDPADNLRAGSNGRGVGYHPWSNNVHRPAMVIAAIAFLLWFYAMVN